MIWDLAFKIVALPVILGVAVACISDLGKTRGVLLIPLAAAAILVAIDGFPPLPPVRAAHKLPYVFIGAGLLFALYAVTVRRASTLVAMASSLAFAALAIWWIGRTFLAGNPQKAVVIAGLLLVAFAALIVMTRRAEAGRAPSSAWPQAVFAMTLAGSAVAVFGGYIGMAMFNGALAAFTGGYLLVAYIAYARGRETAFTLTGVRAYAFAWTAFASIVATALMAPRASAGALIVTALVLVAVPLVNRFAVRFASVPYLLRPFLSGLPAAIPALTGIAIASLQFAG